MYSQKWNCAASLFPKQNYNVLSPNSYTHSHISVRDLYISRISLSIFAAAKYVEWSGEYINRSQTYECGNWDCGAQCPEKESINVYTKSPDHMLRIHFTLQSPLFWKQRHLQNIFTTDLSAFEWDELGPEGGGDGQEGDGEPADEVCEDQESHPLRDLRVVRVPGLRAANGPVHLRRQKKIRLAAVKNERHRIFGLNTNLSKTYT